MTSIHIGPGPIRRHPGFPAAGRRAVVGDVAAGLFYLTSIAIAFAFVLILTTGAHP